MNLATWLSVLIFLLFVAPGLMFDLLAGRRRPGTTESGFREASRIVLASMGFTGFALAIVAAVGASRSDWMPDIGRLIKDGTAYLGSEYGLVARALVLEATVAFGAVIVVHLILARIGAGATIRAVSAWTQVFRRDCPRNHDVYVRVRIGDKLTYTGRLANFSPDLEIEDRELVLAQPLASKAEGAELGAVPGNYQRIVLRGSEITVLSVEYRRSPRRQGWLKRLFAHGSEARHFDAESMNGNGHSLSKPLGNHEEIIEDRSEGERAQQPGLVDPS